MRNLREEERERGAKEEKKFESYTNDKHPAPHKKKLSLGDPQKMINYSKKKLI